MSMERGDTRTYGFPAGVGSLPADRVEREVASDEAPPLAPNGELAWIGKSVARSNGRAKVTGAAHFTVDVKLPGMLHGRLLRSPLPHARLVSLDLGGAVQHAGVRAALQINEAVGRAAETEAGRALGSATASRRVLYVG